METSEIMRIVGVLHLKYHLSSLRYVRDKLPEGPLRSTFNVICDNLDVAVSKVKQMEEFAHESELEVKIEKLEAVLVKVKDRLRQEVIDIKDWNSMEIVAHSHALTRSVLAEEMIKFIEECSS